MRYIAEIVLLELALSFIQAFREASYERREEIKNEKNYQA